MSWARDNEAAARAWRGPTRPYDLVKEFVIALVVISLLTVVFAALFSSPDEHAITLAAWAKADPKDFVATALSELDGTSGTATYGPPYTNTPGTGQNIGPINLQRLAGVRIPVSTAEDFVLEPLRTEAADEPALAQAIQQWTAATPEQQTSWAEAYGTALNSATVTDGTVSVPSGDHGPVPTLMQAELALARDGGLEGAMLTRHAFYGTDYTKPLLFLADGGYLESLAEKEHLLGSQWGMMNENGTYPGQTWLWLYTLWYQVPPFSSSDNADALVWALMLVLTAGFAVLPFIPGLRSLPKRLRVYRLIWRDYYRSLDSGGR
jgi:hypothetical protein